MADDAAGAVRRTPRPHPSTDDHQTPETGAPAAPGTTNPATPVSPDAENASGELSPEIADALAQVRHTAETFRAENPALSANLRRYAADFERRTLGDDVNRVVAEYAALPECTACGGSGKDDHATVFETALAVHFAGPPVKAEGRRRQLCMWCGHVLADLPSRKGETLPEPWPLAAFVKVEDGLATVQPYTAGDPLPPGCCALPDDEEPADLGPAPTSPACTCTENRCDYDDHDNPLTGDECIPCGQRPEGTPCCALDGPDEAQETRAAADWPAETADTHYDEQETDRG